MANPDHGADPEPAKPGRRVTAPRVVGAVAGLIVALGGGSGIAAILGVFDKPGPPSPTVAPDGGPTPPPATSPSVLTKDQVQVSCTVTPAPRPGTTVTLAYTITSKAAGVADLGGEVYSGDGNPHADGFGDKDSFPIQVGVQSVSRPLHVPTGLSSGDYEISAELWPPGRKGAEGVETITDATCATFTVP